MLSPLPRCQTHGRLVNIAIWPGPPSLVKQRTLAKIRPLFISGFYRIVKKRAPDLLVWGLADRSFTCVGQRPQVVSVPVPAVVFVLSVYSNFTLIRFLLLS